MPALWLALSRSNRLVHHLAVLALGLSLRFGGARRLDQRPVRYAARRCAVAVSATYIALGGWALDRGPALLTCCPLLGAVWPGPRLDVELIRILDARGPCRHRDLAELRRLCHRLPGDRGLAALAREKRFARPPAVALILGLLVPPVFWSGAAVGLSAR